MWTSELTPPVSPQRDHIRGPIDAPVTLVEYGDYQCPFCGAAHPIVLAVQREMGDRMRFVFRHFPMTTVHPLAEHAAEAAEAAGAQRRFWDMHDILFESQPRFTDRDLYAYAEMLGLDIDRFARDLASHAHAGRVREHFLSGVWSGVNGTPTFYINSMRHDGPYDFESLLAAVDLAAARA
jgi:protein-disulfide isomerase